MEIRKKTFEKKDILCPHCAKRDVGFGNYKGKNAIGVNCAIISYNDFTGASISKLPKDSFIEYLKCLAKDFLLRQSVKEVETSAQTSFD